MAVSFADAPSSHITVPTKQALEQVFQRINGESCPHYFNFHLHTIHSDGKLKPEEIMEQAMEIGLYGLAITDHHSVGGYEVACKWLANKKGQNLASDRLPDLWSGVEITANLLNTQVHILGYAFDPNHPSMYPYLQGKTCIGIDYQAVNVIAAIHHAGGLAVLAHPARYRKSPADLIPEAVRWGIDGVETYYGYHNPKPWHPSPKETEQVKNLGTTYGLFHTCGTDTHNTNILLRP